MQCTMTGGVGRMACMVRCIADFDKREEERSLDLNSKGRFQMTGMDCFRNCSHNDVEVLEPSRNFGSFADSDWKRW